jgi:hypothetical protein
MGGLAIGYVPGGTASLSDIITGMQQQKAQAQTAAAQPALVQAQTQGQQLQNQEIQRQLQDDQIWRDTMKNTDWSQVWNDPNGMRNLQGQLIRGGMSGRGVVQTMQGLVQLQQNALKLPADQLELVTKEHLQAANAFEGYVNANDPTQWPQTRAAMVKVSPDLDQHLPQTAPTPQQVQELQGYLGMTKHLADLAKSKSEQTLAEASAAASQATAAKNTEEAATAKRGRGAQELQAAIDPQSGLADPAEYSRIQQAYPELRLPSVQSAAKNQSTIKSTVPLEKQPQYGIEQFRLDQMLQAAKGNPNDLGFIDAQIDPKQHADLNQGARAAYQSILTHGGLPEDAVKAVAPFVARASEIDKELNPQVRAARREDEIVKAKSLREGDVPALAGVPPALAGQVVTSAGKLDVDYAHAKAASDTLNDFIDAAEAGNKAAAANIPLAGVLQINTANGTKRINRTEIDQYQGAGSLFDQIAGRLGKLTAGQPIPKDVLEDMRTLANMVGERAWNEYNDSLKSLQQRTGYKGGPTLEAPRGAKSTPGSNLSALPTLLQQSDIGKVFLNKDGKKLKITAVNPNDGTKFKFEVVP